MKRRAGLSSVISHPASTPMSILRADYQAITGHDCEALLLQALEFLTNREGAGEWIYRKFDELEDDILNQYGETKIREAMTALTLQGFVQSRRNKRNSRDATKEWLLIIDKVQEAINALPPFETSKTRSGSLESEGSTLYQEEVEESALRQIVKAYENEIGGITPMVQNRLETLMEEYAAELIINAFKVAVGANKRSLNYVEGILKRGGKFAPKGGESRRKRKLTGIGDEA